jgi:NADH-quinone oxidoreductase subunit M
MNGQHFPWLEVAIVLPLLAALRIRDQTNPQKARRRCVLALSITFLMTTAAWIDFSIQAASRDANISRDQGGWGLLEIDEMNAPLLPVTSLLFLVTAVATLPTKIRRFSFVWSLVRVSVVLAAFACKAPWAVVVFLTLSVIPVWLEIAARGQTSRVFGLYMSLFIGCMVTGQALVSAAEAHSILESIGIGFLVIAILIRCGMFPFHAWMPDMFSRASFGTALLFVTPMPGIYAALRLVLPIAPDWMMHVLVLISLFTAIYAAGLALVQKEARRFYSFLFLSNSSLVLVGLELATPIGLTGSLSLWLSLALALGGFGLTLRCVESRIGVFTIDIYRGLYDHMPALGGFFLLTGLASVGFPGTSGFVGAELIMEGVTAAYPQIGMVIVVAAALNGIAVVMAYLKIFAGQHHRSSISLGLLPPEQVSVFILTVLILAGGLWPQPGIASRFQAATAIIDARRALSHLPATVSRDHDPQSQRGTQQD